MRKFSDPFPIDYLRECLSYDSLSGKFCWKIRPVEHFQSKNGWAIFNASYAGKEAGSVDSLGYRKIVIFKKSMLAHRIAVAFCKGEWPSKEIDHINGDPSDNRIVNLREVGPSVNAWNVPIATESSSGIRGVSWVPHANKWRAQVTTNRVTQFLGYYGTIAAAAKVVEDHKMNLRGEIGRK